MKLLLIDTCGAAGSVALADTVLPTTVIAAEVLPGRSASERLVPVIQTLLETQSWRLQDLAAIVVVHGPGSFTGVRVGLSAAKGLSEASGVPLVAVSRLAVFARGTARVCAVLDAGRGEFYFGEYDGGQYVKEALLTREELIAATGGEVILACEPRILESLNGTLQTRLLAEPLAGDAVTIAAARIEKGQFDDAAILDANYLRRSDAELFARPKVPVA